MNKTLNHFTTMGLLLGLAAITALAMASPVSAAPGQSRGGSRGGLPYATASTVSQLIADINYANTVGGAITINLAPGASFDLRIADNGGNGLPVIGGTKAVVLTIIGNGATIRRIAEYTKWNYVKNPFGLFNVALGSSLTLDQVTLKGAWYGAIFNRGTLNLINGCTLSGNGNDGAIYNAGGAVTVSDSTISGNGATHGGGIYNDASGTVTLNNSTLSGSYARSGGGIYNDGGTVTLNSSTLSGNQAEIDYSGLGGDGGGIYNAGGTVAISDSNLFNNHLSLTGEGAGGGIYNDPEGTVTVKNFSSITDPVANLGVLYQDGTSTISFLYGNSAIPF